MAEFAHDLDAQRRLRELEKRLAQGGPPTDNGGMEARLSALEAIIKELPTKGSFAELRADFAAFKADSVKSLGELRVDLTKTQGDLRTELTKGFGEIRADLHKNTIDVQRWMIATVIGLFLGFGGLFLAMSNALKPASGTIQQQASATPTQPPIIINVPGPTANPVQEK